MGGINSGAAVGVGDQAGRAQAARETERKANTVSTITGRDVLKALSTATEEELDAPIEVSVRTYTKVYGEYPHVFEAKMFHGGGLRIHTSFPEGVTISKRKVRV